MMRIMLRTRRRRITLLMLVVVVVMILIMVLVRVAAKKWFFLAYPLDCRNEHAIMSKLLVYFANTTIPNILEVGLAIQESCSLRITREWPKTWLFSSQHKKTHRWISCMKGPKKRCRFPCSSCSIDQGTQEKPTYDYKHSIEDKNNEVGQGQWQDHHHHHPFIAECLHSHKQLMIHRLRIWRRGGVQRSPGALPHAAWSAEGYMKENSYINVYIYTYIIINFRGLTYPTLGKGKSSSKCHFWGIC